MPQVLEFYERIGCSLKTLETMCELNHYSHEVLQGRPFKAFNCRCGWSSGTEMDWRKAVETHLRLEGQELRDADLEHSRLPGHCRHKPYKPPLFLQDALDMSADVLHLIFINMFTFFFEMTLLVHVNEMERHLREPFEVYCRSIGLPLKISKALNVEEMKQSLTGRDAKVIMSQAFEHIPILLEYAHASKSDLEEQVNDGQRQERPPPHAGVPLHRNEDDDFTWEGDDEDFAPEEDTDDDDVVPRMLRDARSWDKFRTLCYAMRPFEADDSEYRKVRAVEAFNAAADVMEEYKRLNPQAVSACPHVALCVVPRQMVAHGDPGRRGTDQSESYGASIKDSLHRRCLRRKKSAQAELHRRRDKDGNVTKTWLQRALSVSRVMQTFRDQSVRERLLRDDESVPYLLRKHNNLAKTGFATVGEAAARDEQCYELFSIVSARMAEGRNLA